MSGAVRKHWYLFGLITVFIVGVPFAAQAQYYTKYYEFGAATEQTGVAATLFGYEYILDSYSDPWGPGAWGMGTLPYTTAVNFGGAGATGDIAVGWTTWDMSCFLWDLRWDGGAPIMPTASGGAPGGGVFVWDEEGATWTICNQLLAPDPEGGNGDLGGDNAVPLRPTIYFPSHLDLWVFDSAPTFGEIGGFVGPGGDETPGFSMDQIVQVGPTHYNVEDLLPNGLPSSLGPGECLPIPMPDIRRGQSLLLTGPMLDGPNNVAGYYGEMVNTTPEPCTLVLLACTGLPLLARLRRRRK